MVATAHSRAWIPVIALAVAGMTTALCVSTQPREVMIAGLFLLALALPSIILALPIALNGAALVVLTALATVWRLALAGIVVLTMAHDHRAAALAVLVGAACALCADLTLRLLTLPRESSRA